MSVIFKCSKLKKVKFLDWHPPHWFDLTKLNRMYSIRQGAFKSELVLILMMLDPNFNKTFILDVNQFIRGQQGRVIPKRWHGIPHKK